MRLCVYVRLNHLTKNWYDFESDVCHGNLWHERMVLSGKFRELKRLRAHSRHSRPVTSSVTSRNDCVRRVDSRTFHGWWGSIWLTCSVQWRGRCQGQGQGQGQGHCRVTRLWQRVSTDEHLITRHRRRRHHHHHCRPSTNGSLGHWVTMTSSAHLVVMVTSRQVCCLVCTVFNGWLLNSNSELTRKLTREIDR